ncbi:ligase-associated DNA damage response endonuclease PdeM [Hwanghaeella grinnelliae]|uniref:Ligase-associated DNA damage response endonuclease PdeM n=2 Tax=Hwanghaeella grinnelliae TaxID=2500179 RepID=A0A3S2W2M8_9PROT|nr:ligase-associated DNA damage response endonuclease PdeM [Hwanghaeella grinnelliae]
MVEAAHRTTIRLNGADLEPDLSGALFWRARNTLIVADLHFEKGSALASRGQLLPPYDTRSTLKKLNEALHRTEAARVISLGDSFHDGDAGARLPNEDRAALIDLTNRVEWIWVAGNHDPEPPPDLGGTIVEEFTDGPLLFRHEASNRPSAGEVSGHFHPKATVKTRMSRVSARCFVSDGRRLILPSFGAFTGGLNVRDPAIEQHFPQGFNIWLLGRSGIHRFPKSATLGRSTKG